MAGNGVITGSLDAMLIRAYGLLWSADEVEWYGYLLGTYRIASALEPNSS
jgi:hypothetical protein